MAVFPQGRIISLFQGKICNICGCRAESKQLAWGDLQHRTSSTAESASVPPNLLPLYTPTFALESVQTISHANYGLSHGLLRE